MAESELKLDMPCPRCGTSNTPSASRCRQCFQDLDPGPGVAPKSATPPGLFDFPRAMVPCPQCGKSNAFNMESCVDCGAAMSTGKLPSLESMIAPARLRKAVRGHRKADGAKSAPFRVNMIWLMRLCSVLFLFWGVIDTSHWLDKVTRGIAPDDPTIIRYSLFAMYELGRNLSIVAGIWLLTYLKPNR